MQRDQVSALVLKGMTTRQIAEKVGISQRTVVRDIQHLQAQWREKALEAIDQVKARELASLDIMEAEAWDAYNRSKQDYTKKVVEDKPTGKGRSARIETGSQHGDPRLFNVILSIKERRAKLLGMDAPTKIAGTNPEGTEERPLAVVAMPAQMGMDEWQQTFVKPAS